MARRFLWKRFLVFIGLVVLLVALQQATMLSLESFCPTVEKVCMKYEPITISILRSEGEVFVDGKICVEHEEVE